MAILFPLEKIERGNNNLIDLILLVFLPWKLDQ